MIEFFYPLIPGDGSIEAFVAIVDSPDYKQWLEDAPAHLVPTDVRPIFPMLEPNTTHVWANAYVFEFESEEAMVAFKLRWL